MNINGVLGEDRNIKHFFIKNSNVYINTMMYASKAFNAKNNAANKPIATKIPTQISIALFLIRAPVYSF